MSDSKLANRINELLTRTEAGKIKWRPLPDYTKPNQPLAEYVSINTNVYSGKEKAVRNTALNFQYTQLQLEQSLISEVSAGIIYIFQYYYRNTPFKNKAFEIIDEFNRRNAPILGKIDTYLSLIIAIQGDLNSPIVEQNILDEEQELIRKLYVQAIRNSEGNDKFFNELFSDNS